MRRGDRLGALRSVTTGPGAHETRTDRIHRRGVRGLGALAVLTVVVLALGLASSARAASPGEISGKVTAAVGGGAISGIEVCAYSTSEELGPEGFGCERTDSSGEYTITGLAAGDYDVEFSSQPESEPGYITQYWKDTTQYEDATPVTVNGGFITREINAALEEGGSITGQVESASGHTIEGIEACAYMPKGEGFGCAKTKSGGTYSITGLAQGKYVVEFSSPFDSGLDFVTQYWEYAAKASKATEVEVKPPDTVSDIDAKLQEGGRIEGRVTDASTGAALSDVLVCASPVGGVGSLEECVFTGSSGEYTLAALASGNYIVVFSKGKEYVTQYYDDKSSPSEANEVSVTAPNTVSGINAAMQLTSTAPVNTKAPVVSGTAAVDATLSCAPGLWTGKPTPTYSYQWLRNGAPITGASSSSYAVQTADAGQSVSCQVTAHNSAGEKTATSAGVAIPALPVVTSPPTTPSATHPTVKILSVAFVASKKSVTVRIQCSQAACRGSIKLTMQIVVQRRKGKSKKNVTRKQTVTLATGAYSLAVNKSATVSLRLTATGKSKLAQAKRHALSVKITCSVQGGAAAVKAARLK